MATYKIIATSWVLWILTFLTTILSGAFISHEILPRDTTITFIAVIGIMAFALFVKRFVSRAEVEFKLTDNDISIIWHKQFLFHKRPNLEILLGDIESYKYQEDRNFDLFKLTLKDGTQIKLWHFTFTRGDDFERLVFDFPSKVERYNKKAEKRAIATRTEKPAKILREKTIFEEAYAPLLAGFAILLLIAVPYLIFFNPDKKVSNPYMGLAAMAGGLFFLIQYFKYRKEKNEK
jgi:predicted ATP-dependent protease